MTRLSVLPNLMTILNMFLGYFAVIRILDDRFIAASWLIILATFFDFLDGRLARLTDSSSKFGTEFDSLADLVTFGFAPSILYYKMFFHKLGILGLGLSFFPLLFGAFRLARFNITQGGKDKKFFSGLPIPTAAMLLVSFVTFAHSFWGDFWEAYRFSKSAIMLVLLTSFLMISKIEYDVVPNLSLTAIKKSWFKPVIFIVGLITLPIFPAEAFFLWTLFVIFFGIGRWIIQLFSPDEESVVSANK